MTETTKIHEAMVAILSDLPSIGKDQYNKGQRYAFRGIDQFLNTLHPLFAKHHVFVTPLVEHVERTEKVGTRYNSSKGTDEEYITFYSVATVRFRFHAEDGSSVDCVTIGEGMDNGDKATNKALSAAFKYALIQTFSVPTEDLVDADAESPEVTNTATPREAPAPQPAPQSDVGGVRDEQLAELRIYLDANGIEVADAERYCVSIKYLKDGEHLSKLTDARLSKINGNLSRFGNAIIDYIADSPQDDGGTDE